MKLLKNLTTREPLVSTGFSTSSFQDCFPTTSRTKWSCFRFMYRSFQGPFSWPRDVRINLWRVRKPDHGLGSLSPGWGSSPQNKNNNTQQRQKNISRGGNVRLSSWLSSLFECANTRGKFCGRVNRLFFNILVFMFRSEKETLLSAEKGTHFDILFRTKCFQWRTNHINWRKWIRSLYDKKRRFRLLQAFPKIIKTDRSFPVFKRASFRNARTESSQWKNVRSRDKATNS